VGEPGKKKPVVFVCALRDEEVTLCVCGMRGVREANGKHARKGVDETRAKPGPERREGKQRGDTEGPGKAGGQQWLFTRTARFNAEAVRRRRKMAGGKTNPTSGPFPEHKQPAGKDTAGPGRACIK